MGQAMGHEQFHAVWQLRRIPRQCIAHLDRRGRLRRPVLQHIGQILARVPAAAEKQRDLPPRRGGNDAAE